MFKLFPPSKIVFATSLVALAALTACSSGAGSSNATAEPTAPTRSAVASAQPSTQAADLPNPSDSAIALAELEQKWSLNVPEGEENPCPCEFGNTSMTKDQQQMAILPLFGNHAAITYSEITLGSYGQATLYLVARDRYVGDTNKSVNYEGFAYEAWLVSEGEPLDADGSRVAASVAVTGQTSLSEAYRKGQLLSRFADLSGNRPSEPIESPTTDIVVSKADFRTQTATLENRGDSDVDLKGWRLEGTNKREVYIFSEGMVLKAGKSLVVRAGLTGGQISSDSEILWGNNRFPWRHDGDQAILRNPKEQIVSHYEAPNLTEPVIIGEYTDLPITKKVTMNKGVMNAIARLNVAIGGASAYQLSEAKQSQSSDGRTTWMLMLRPEGQTDGPFADVRIDPSSGELLAVYGLGEKTELTSSVESANELAKQGNDFLRRLTGDAAADYRLIDIVEMPAYVILTMARSDNDEYRVFHSDAEGFTTVLRPWMYNW